MDDDPCCPLCTEELDASDLGFFPCRCRFQVCPFCYGRLKEGGGLCPGCRAPYKDQEPVYEKPDLDKLREQREELKQREREEKQHASKTLDSLANVRVIQRNLVYVTGLPLKHAYDDVLAGPKWFKPHGKILKCVANRSVQYNSNSPYGPTVSAYVTYSKHEEALEAIKKLDNTMHEGHNLRCSFGTTKYCNNFLRGLECTNPDCMYLHKVQEDDDTYLRAQLSRNQDSRSRTEFHDKTHPQFQEHMAAQQMEQEFQQMMPQQQQQQQPPSPAQNHTTGAGVPLPAPLPPTRAGISTIAERVAAAPAVPEQTAPTQADPVAPQIPIPRPVRPQVGPPSDVMAPAPSLPFKSSAPISAPGSAPWSRSSSMDQLHGAQGPLHEPAPQPPQHSHEPANTVNTMTNQFQEDPVHEPSNSVNNVDPVASAANAALSTNSLFSAFANSQQAAPGLEPNLGLWPSSTETSWQQSQPSTNSVFGGSNFSLWGDMPAASNVVSNEAQRGLGAAHDLWGTSIGAAQPASSSQSFVGPPSHQPQQATGHPPQPQVPVADWQSAFRALLPDVNVHFEGGPQQAAPASVSASASANIWGTSSSDTNIVQNQGNSGLTWNLPAMLQPPGLPQPQAPQPSHSNPSNGMDPLYQGAQWPQNSFDKAPAIPTMDKTIGAPGSQSNGNNASNSSRKSKGGKKRGKKN